MADPIPTPNPVPTPAPTVDHLKQILALIEELPALVTDVVALVNALKTHDLAGSLAKLQQVVQDLKTALS